MEPMSDEVKAKVERKQRIFKRLKRAAAATVAAALVLLLLWNIYIPRRISGTFEAFEVGEDLRPVSDEAAALTLDLRYKNYLLRPDGSDALSGSVEFTPPAGSGFGFDTRSPYMFGSDDWSFFVYGDKWDENSLAEAALTAYDAGKNGFTLNSMIFNKDFTLILIWNANTGSLYCVRDASISDEEYARYFENIVLFFGGTRYGIQPEAAQAAPQTGRSAA